MNRQHFSKVANIMAQTALFCYDKNYTSVTVLLLNTFTYKLCSFGKHCLIIEVNKQILDFISSLCIALVICINF